MQERAESLEFYQIAAQCSSQRLQPWLEVKRGMAKPLFNTGLLFNILLDNAKWSTPAT
jgi:hypothetical protein